MPMNRGRVRVQEGDFSADAELARLLSGRVGGTVLFIGSVRGSSSEGKVPHLDFESYGPMAEQALERIRRRAMRRFGVEDITVIHRTGRIRSCGRVVLVAASAAHRVAAFKACRFVLEELKKRVPIWKKERGVWTCGEGPARHGSVKKTRLERTVKKGPLVKQTVKRGRGGR
jgi:molybdopterin synthase catalytic subunit